MIYKFNFICYICIGFERLGQNKVTVIKEVTTISFVHMYICVHPLFK